MMKSCAPPPSPVWHGLPVNESSDNDELDSFLQHSFRIPSLVLPKKQSGASEEAPEETGLVVVDYNSILTSGADEAIRDAARRMGCFQLVNHGIAWETIRAVGRVFRSALREKEDFARSELRGNGFEKDDGDELFWWNKEENMFDFRMEMEALWRELEKIACKLVRILLDVDISNSKTAITPRGKHQKSFLCLRRHISGRDETGELSGNTLHPEAVRMLLRNSFCSYSLCFSIWTGGSEGFFQVYSGRGWRSFKPKDGALVVIVGDQLQTWSRGLYKHVSGKPVLQRTISANDDRHEEEEEELISVDFLYSQTQGGGRSSSVRKSGEEKTISLFLQLKLVIFLVIFYHFVMYFSSNHI